MSETRPEPLRNFIQRHLANLCRVHDEGECGGRPCPYCDYERQFPGRPYWRMIAERERLEVEGLKGQWAEEDRP